MPADFVVGAKPTDAYLRALRETGRLVSVVELWDAAGERPYFTNDTERRTDGLPWGAVPFDQTFDRGATEQRSGEIVVPIQPDQVLTHVPLYPGHVLHPASGNTIRIWSGYRVPSSLVVPIARLDDAESSEAANLDYAVSPGTNRLLVVGIGRTGGIDETVDSVTYGGQPMIEVDTAGVVGEFYIASMWYILDAGIAAAVGTTIDPTFSTADGVKWILTAASYSNVNQAGEASTLVDLRAQSRVFTGPDPLDALGLRESVGNLVVCIASCHANTPPEISAVWQLDMTEQAEDAVTDTLGASYADRLAITNDPVTVSPDFTASFAMSGVTAEFQGATAGAIDEMYRVATVDVDEVQLVLDADLAEVFILTVDRTDRLRVDFDTAGTIDAGTNNVTAALDLIGEVLQPDQHPVNAKSTVFTTPLIEYAVGDGRRDLLDDLLEAVGYELTSDEYGALHIGPVNETYVHDGTDPQWLYGDGADDLPVSDVRVNLENFKPGGIVVTGGSSSEESDAIEAIVYDADPDSLTFYNPTSISPGPELMKLQNDLILSVEQGTLAGIAQLRGSRLGRGFVGFQATPNPALRDGDVVKFGYAAGGLEPAMFTVESVSISPDADGSIMEVELRYSWDPSGAFVDTGSGVLPPPVASQTDNFNRGDEDLENADWVEHGQSWNVRSNQASQGLSNSWCFARRVEPLTTSEHRASVLIKLVPAGADTWIGPMIRSGGQFNGYAALVRSGGQTVGLYKMQNSQIGGQLGATWSDGLTMEGRIIEVQAEGNTIKVRVAGVVKITETDSSFPGGRSVGMVARGANEWDTPQLTPFCDDFSAGVAI